MTRSNALESEDAVTASKYWDVRSPGTYHLDPDCPVGRWIPRDATLWGTMTAARGCRECAAPAAAAANEPEVAAPVIAAVVAPPAEPVTPISVRGSYLFAI
jgi:hypothetical protein